eukprot:27356_3
MLNAATPYGIFQRNEDGTGKWLKEDRTIVAYDLKQNDTVEFRKKQRPLKLKLVDGSQKTVIVDEKHPRDGCATVGKESRTRQSRRVFHDRRKIGLGSNPNLLTCGAKYQ